jgi:hemin uptake protein HemP
MQAKVRHPRAAAARLQRHVNASCLFGSAQEIVIAHAGRVYHLQMTAQKELVLKAAARK